MLTAEDVLKIFGRVKYRDWQFKLNWLENGWLMFVAFADGSGAVQHGRKWHISQHACNCEVVQTCLKAILTAVEHEVREQFLFDGIAIYGPHLDAEALKAVPHQVRPPSPALPEAQARSHSGDDMAYQNTSGAIISQCANTLRRYD